MQGRPKQAIEKPKQQTRERQIVRRLLLSLGTTEYFQFADVDKGTKV